MNAEHLQRPYSPQVFNELLSGVFSASFQPSLKPVEIDDEKWKAEFVVKIEQCGQVLLADGARMNVFAVQLRNKSIAYNRVGLRKIIADYLKTEGAVLAAFYSEDQPDWRLSLIVRQVGINEAGQIERTETHPRRFTYVLGPNETCKTAAERLQELEQKETCSLRNLLDAFNVEKLNKEFFDEYVRQYQEFGTRLAESEYVRSVWNLQANPRDWKTDPEFKPARDFVKLMLGRIVFLYFIQKKGWLGCPITDNPEDWSEGNPQFLSHFFANFPNPEHFHSAGLCRLFYQTLNRDCETEGRQNYAFDFNGQTVKIPYLNGGLFDNPHPETARIDFPPQLFEQLFAFLDRYNFTIYEDGPNDQEIGIDPEMMGHIFENLLEDNKDRGAFYTPKEIVHYMCQESLAAWLKTQLNAQDGTPEAHAVENFVRRQEFKYNDRADYISKNARTISKLLEGIKICDPAIGSGAFPMGLLQELVLCRTALNLTLADEETIFEFKKSIIQQNIYGVDLDGGAVEIARLRFWLSLVVDDNRPHPLPNLDYKIMQGNSLLERFEGYDLSTLAESDKPLTQITLHGNRLFVPDRELQLVERNQTRRAGLQELTDGYFDEKNSARKREVRKQIDDIIMQSVEENLHARRLQNQEEIARKEKQLAAQTIGLNAKQRETLKTKSKEAKELAKLRERQNGIDAAYQRFSQIYAQDERPFFLWRLFFKDVFARQNPGFDMVIGNPPYVQLQKMGERAAALQEAGYQTFEKTGDIYCLFYERACQLLRNNGVFAYITSNKWMRANYGAKTRKLLSEKFAPKILYDLGGYKVFESATVDSVILIAAKSETGGEFSACKIDKTFDENTDLLEYFGQRSVRMTAAGEDPWLVMDARFVQLKKKIHAQGLKLTEWKIDINYGIKTGLNEAFIIDTETKERLIAEDPRSAELIKPILRGRDVKKWQPEWSGNWVIFIPWHFPLHSNPSIKGASLEAEELLSKLYPTIYKHLLEYKSQLENRNQSETGIRYEWYALQRWASDYWQSFEKPKIIYPNMTAFLPFIYDESGFYINDKGFILTGERLKYLAAFFNSTLFKFAFQDNFPELLGGTRELRKVFFEQIPVPVPDAETEAAIEGLVDQITAAKAGKDFPLLTETESQSPAPPADVSELEAQIDALVYALYGLTETDKELIADWFKPPVPLARPAPAAPALPPAVVETQALIAAGESRTVEFKSTLRINLKTGQPDKKMEHSVVKTLAAFLNSEGGTLLIGVDDERNVLGLETDFASFSKPDKLDEFQKHFDNLLAKTLGDGVHRHLSVDFPEWDGKTVCRIAVRDKAPAPVYLKDENNNEQFYIRRLASTKDLSISEATKYINEHWKA